MNEAEFWNLIAASKQESQGNTVRQLVLLERTLERSSEREIQDFHRLLHDQMDRSYSWDLWAAAYIINGGCSDDGFDYFRAWLIAQGREIFEQASKDPETLADAAQAGVELEELLYVAAKAYETKTGKKFPYPRRSPAKLTGEAWEEDEPVLQAKYPKLFARFWTPDAGVNEAGKNMIAGAALSLLKKFAAKAGSGNPEAERLFVEAVFQNQDETPEILAKKAALLNQAADLGHAKSQYLLGLYYLQGRGVPQSYPQGAKRFHQAAEQGNADACAELGRLYQSGLELDQDYDAAFKWYQKGAASGSAGCEFGLGVLYSNGWGVEKDPQEAFKWSHRAAQNNHEQAALNVGLFFLNGKGVEPDAGQAFQWFSRAAEAGLARAQFNLGVLYEKGRGVEQDTPKAIEMYERAAAQEYSGAMLNLSVLYSSGRGVAQDYAKAADWCQRAVKAGDQTALSNLAVFYQHGRGVPKDLAEACRLYRQSAEAGIAAGLFNLGSMYHRGIGVAQDDHEALRWYHLAAAQNYAPAFNNIADAYENGYGGPQDYAEAVKWYRRAAEGGISAAYYSLGVLHRDGKGVKQDYHEAENFLKTAVEKGFEKAAPVLKALYQDGHLKRPASAASTPSTTTAKAPDDSGQKIVSPQAAAQRALCLQALMQRAQFELLFSRAGQDPKLAEKTNSGEFKAEVLNINAWLKDNGLWLVGSDQEKALMGLNPGSWPERALKQIGWRAEALGVIGWALGLKDHIFPYDIQIGESCSLKILISAKQFVSETRLRDEKEILAAREIAEAWLWRARTTQIQKEPKKYPPPPGHTYEQIIRTVAEHWEKAGLFKTIKGDFPVLGKAYAELTDEEWLGLRSIATERLYGLNWLCKYSDDWDRVPAGT